MSKQVSVWDCIKIWKETWIDLYELEFKDDSIKRHKTIWDYPKTHSDHCLGQRGNSTELTLRSCISEMEEYYAIIFEQEFVKKIKSVNYLNVFCFLRKRLHIQDRVALRTLHDLGFKDLILFTISLTVIFTSFRKWKKNWVERNFIVMKQRWFFC